MLTVEEFRNLLKGADPLEIVDRVILGHAPVHVIPKHVTLIATILAEAYGIQPGEVEIHITGSARLGFSLVEKGQRGDEFFLPRYRPFSAHSDIDVAVISRPIFDMIWHDLSSYSHRAPWFPPKARRLGDYLVCGWLRPDHFPKGVRLRRCDDWWDTFNKISKNSEFKRRRVNGGLFASIVHLRQYMSRAVSDCIQQEGGQ
jgi:hypothetical protein